MASYSAVSLPQLLHHHQHWKITCFLKEISFLFGASNSKNQVHRKLCMMRFSPVLLLTGSLYSAALTPNNPANNVEQPKAAPSSLIESYIDVKECFIIIQFCLTNSISKYDYRTESNPALEYNQICHTKIFKKDALKRCFPSINSTNCVWLYVWLFESSLSSGSTLLQHQHQHLPCCVQSS